MALRSGFVAFAGIATLASVIWCQQPPSFDVSVIKPADPANTRFGMGFGPDGRTLTVDGLTVIQIIREAYGVLPDEVSVRPSAASGGWIDSQRFDISAKSEGHGPVDKEQSTLMLRQLLADRFGLVIHRETKELIVYSLVVGKNGPKLKEGGTEGPYLSGPAPGKLVGTRASMASLTRALSRSLGRPVNDETGLHGQYDFTLSWTPDEAAADTTGPSLFTAFQDQLGLKLESKKAPVETVVIDHIATPSPN
jgi:uncharacterized protein (TIGR03435 family)